MSTQRDFDMLLRSWFDESAPSGQPEGLLEAVLGTTSHAGRALLGWFDSAASRCSSEAAQG